MRPGLAHFGAKARRIVGALALGGLSALACGRGASPRAPEAPACDELVRVGCPCPAGLEPLGGGCAPPAVLARVCGARVDPDDLSCSPVLCPGGDALDPSRGACIPPRELAALPEIAWLGLHEGERLSCADGGTLELAQGRAGCRPEGVCRFHTTWDGKECARPTPCPTGTFREAALCKPFVTAGTVDLSTWLRRVAEPELCALLLGPNPQSFHLVADAEGNGLAHLSVAVEGTTPALPLVRRAAEALADGLRSLRLDTSTTHTELTITCPAHPFPAPKVEAPDSGAP